MRKLFVFIMAFMISFVFVMNVNAGILSKKYTQKDPPEWIIKNVKLIAGLKYDRKIGMFVGKWKATDESPMPEIIIRVSKDKFIQCVKKNSHGQRAVYECFATKKFTEVKHESK